MSGRFAEALVKIGPPTVPALIAALEDEDKQVRRWAASALGRIGLDVRRGERGGAFPAAKEAVLVLIAALKDEDEQVRTDAVRALVKIGPVAVPALIAALKDDFVLVRTNAAWGLGHIGPAAKQAIPALEAAARDGLRAAESALKKIRDDG